MLPFAKPADLADVRSVGIPRALLWYRYGALWEEFFRSLGREVVLSGQTDKGVLAAGEARSVDECCLASKLYFGHAAQLVGACDALFVPAYANEGRLASFCTKFQSLPDLTACTLADEGVRTFGVFVDRVGERTSARKAFQDLAERFGARPKEAVEAWKAAAHAQQQREAAQARRFADGLERARQGTGLSILLVAHAYVAHDPYVGGDIVRMLEDLGAHVVMADEADRQRAWKRSFEFSDTMPWAPNRELVGALLEALDAVDGVVLASAFPCGPDSMTNDAIARCVQGKPMLSLTIDAQSGTAGLETRVESFVDILSYRKKGGYLHG